MQNTATSLARRAVYAGVISNSFVVFVVAFVSLLVALSVPFDDLNGAVFTLHALCCKHDGCSDFHITPRDFLMSSTGLRVRSEKNK